MYLLLNNTLKKSRLQKIALSSAILKIRHPETQKVPLFLQKNAAKIKKAPEEAPDAFAF